MLAYETKCAVCALAHRELLDAAHIVPDSEPRGLPVIQNGLALCKIHHAAYDRNILGIRPDYVIEIHHRLLDEIDGPMLTYGIQQDQETRNPVDVFPWRCVHCHRAVARTVLDSWEEHGTCQPV